MKKLKYIPAFLFTTFFFTGYAQFELDGTVQLQPYFGFQEGIIKGISNDPAFGKPLVRHVYLVKANVVALTIDALAPETTGIRYYDAHREDSVIITDGNKIPQHLFEEAGIDEFVTPKQREEGHTGHFNFIYRNDKKLGWLAGPGGNMYWPVQPMYGERLNTKWADNSANYTVFSEDDNSFSAGVQPVKIFRKTRPHFKSSEGPEWDSNHGERHDIYLELSQEISPGKSYSIHFKDEQLNTSKVSFRFSDRSLRTEAIHANQAGYHPQQPKKAYLSCWMGNGGAVSYDETSVFYLLDNYTTEPVFEGRLKKVLSGDKPEIDTKRSGPLNFSQTDVYELDFSGFTEPGLYKIHIPGIGVSFPFQIENEVWQKSFKLQMMGFLHQRSGMELGAPYTTYTRPRNFHPEDHFTIRECDPAKFFSKEGPERMQHQIFESIARSIDLGSENKDAWGGWADAADYDRRFHHFGAVLNMIDLLDYNPEYFENLKLNVPETGNKIPDILDEALWCTELWRRTQKPDGEVTIGVESIVHPRRGETSWLDGLPVALMPGTPDAAYNFITAAAQLAEKLQKYNPVLADEYSQSALLAYDWVIKNEGNPKFERFSAAVYEKAAANIALFSLTKEEKFHRQGLQLMQKAFDEKFSGLNYSNGRVVFIYTFLNEKSIDKRVQQNCRKAIISVADDLIRGAKETAYQVIRPSDDTYKNWIIETIDSQLLILAHQLTGDKKYIEALAQSSQFGMGANPLNLSYTSGLGTRFIYPFHLDSQFGGIGVPSGIPAYGPYYLNPNDLPENSWGWDKKDVEDFKSQLYPQNVLEWPWFETYFRYIGWPPINEFTIHQGMRDQMLRWGYLAQYYAK